MILTFPMHTVFFRIFRHKSKISSRASGSTFSNSANPHLPSNFARITPTGNSVRAAGARGRATKTISEDRPKNGFWRNLERPGTSSSRKKYNTSGRISRPDYHNSSKLQMEKPRPYPLRKTTSANQKEIHQVRQTRKGDCLPLIGG